jgi:hypothetical protein
VTGSENIAFIYSIKVHSRVVNKMRSWQCSKATFVHYVTVVVQCAKAPGIRGNVAGSIPALIPRYCTITTINALRNTKKKKKYVQYVQYEDRTEVPSLVDSVASLL